MAAELQWAYERPTYAEAEAALNRLACELHPAGDSTVRGLAETLTCTGWA